MGEKDITEKILEDHNDVFADIINGLIFAGEQRILPESLENTAVHSQYKADDEKVHELERDVAKYWKDQDVQLAICGIENQSSVEKYMPFRIIGYDGTAYRSQLQDKRKEILPVMTIVLYFGTEHCWYGKRNIKGLMKIPEGLDDYINDYKMQVFEVAWLTEEQISRFRSDFKIVANFFVQKRKNKDYMAVFLELADLIVIFAYGTMKSVLKRGYYRDFVVTVNHSVMVGALAILYLFLLQQAQCMCARNG